ncbi:hypothetical protein Tco_1199031, partial [Tanacetum coccineum]
FQWVINQAKKLGLPPPPALATFGITAEDKKKKRIEILKEVFVTKNITVDGMHRNLIPPPWVVSIDGLLIRIQRSIYSGTPEADEMFRKLELTIKARDDVAQVMKGLSECKALEINFRRIQVKDIVKEVKDYLKTYSSAGMDISWQETQYLLKARQKVIIGQDSHWNREERVLKLLRGWNPTREKQPVPKVDMDPTDAEIEKRNRARELHVLALELPNVFLRRKYDSIPKRLEEEYHTIKDDTPLVNVYTTREVTVPGMQIPNDLLTNAIKDTQAYKDYVEKYEGVEVPTIQPEPKKKKKGKQIAGELSSPKPSLKIRIKQKKSTPTTPLPPKNRQSYKEQQNVAAIEMKILEEYVEKLVEGEDEYDGDKFADTILLSYEDSNDDDKHDDAKDLVDIAKFCDATL